MSHDNGDVSMAFWKIEHPGKDPVAFDARTGAQWSYADLRNDVERIQAALPRFGRKSLGLLLAENRYECLAAYLAALNAGSALILLDAKLNSTLLGDFLSMYRPDWIFAPQSQVSLPGYRKPASEEPGLFEIDKPDDIELYPDLALMLSTSGSTGSPKLVRLTLKNLSANATSIAQYLELTSLDRPITSLPFSYSYGLSVINSHLHAGATLIFTEDGILRREFWDAVDRYRVTSFAGVPYTYQILMQTGLLTNKSESFKVLTQAGGRLEPRHIQQIYNLALACGWKFFVMYGQTEATARISYVPFDQLGRKIGSVGIAVPQGSLTLDSETGELMYSGPNVMLGYADSRLELAKGDELHGVLRTGDLARRDEEGYHYITGRSKRFLKLFGKRFNLDDVEATLSRRFETTIACYGRDDLLTIVAENCDCPEVMQQIACEIFDLPRTAVKAVSVNKLPLTTNGKLDYQCLAAGKRYSSPAITYQ
jgi:long-chain acyl-CoA synthetase